MSAELNIAQKALHNAGDVISQLRTRNELLSVSKKIANGYVKKAEQASLNALFYSINKAYPDDDILTADESLTDHKNAIRAWHITPLDGALNLLYDVPHCAVALSMYEKGQCQMIMIYNPLNDETYAATKGSGCYHNQRRVRIDNDCIAPQILVGTNKPENNKATAPHQLALKSISKQVIDIKVQNCPLLDMAMVATGQIDAYWQHGMPSFYTDGLALMVKESGGQCLDFTAGEQWNEKQQMVAGSLHNVTWLVAQLKGIYSPS